MTRRNPSGDSSLIILAGVGIAGYLLWQNGTLKSWFPSLFGSAATSPTATTTTTTGTTTGATNNEIPPTAPFTSPPNQPSGVAVDPCAGVPVGSFIGAVNEGLWTDNQVAFANALGVPQACQTELSNEAAAIHAGISALSGLGAGNRQNRAVIHGRGTYRMRRTA